MKVPPGFQSTLASQGAEAFSRKVNADYHRRAAVASAQGDVLEAARIRTEGNKARAFGFALRAYHIEIESSRLKRAAKIIQEKG